MLTEIEWHPTGRQLRVFGVSGLLASIVAAAVLSFVWDVALVWAAMVLVAGGGIFLCSRISLRAARVLFIGLTVVGLPFGFAVSLILLAAFYFLVLTPLALAFRVIGRDPLHLAWRSSSRGAPAQDTLCTTHKETSYWVPHKPAENRERYFHQF